MLVYLVLSSVLNQITEVFLEARSRFLKVPYFLFWFEIFIFQILIQVPAATDIPETSNKMC